MSGNKIETTLVFDNTLGGHHLEYLHHLYTFAVSNPHRKYIFAIPDSFGDFSGKLDWQESTNVTFHFIKEELCCRNLSWLRRSYTLSKLLHEIARIYGVERIFLISLMPFLPFLPFMIGSHFKISGIIYKIYLYTWTEKRISGRGLDVFKYLLLSRFRVFDKVFLLNDEFAPLYLNKLYKCNKFHYLPDPYSPVSSVSTCNLRKEWGVTDNQKIIIHFGGLCRRKGTLNVFEMIQMTPHSEWNKYVFIFAGKVYKDIREEFYLHYNVLKQNIRILVFDEFCSFDFIESLCVSCDAILLPYHETAQSSGVIGYAAQFRKPVIVPRQGLLGKLVCRNALGILFDDMTPNSIYNALKKVDDWEMGDKKYIETRTVDDFLKGLA